MAFMWKNYAGEIQGPAANFKGEFVGNYHPDDAYAPVDGPEEARTNNWMKNNPNYNGVNNGLNLNNYNDGRNAAADQWWSSYVTGRR